MRHRVFTGTPWEAKVGYCRAVRAGSHIYVSGTAPVNLDGTTHAPGDAYAQTRKCLEVACDALSQLGAGVEHVVRTRIFVTDVQRWREIGRAHAEVFGAGPPATSMVEVRALIAPDMLVEIEVDAVLD
jgi:isochorismate pyruvate lyase